MVLSFCRAKSNHFASFVVLLRGGRILLPPAAALFPSGTPCAKLFILIPAELFTLPPAAASRRGLLIVPAALFFRLMPPRHLLFPYQPQKVDKKGLVVANCACSDHLKSSYDLWRFADSFLLRALTRALWCKETKIKKYHHYHLSLITCQLLLIFIFIHCLDLFHVSRSEDFICVATDYFFSYAEGEYCCLRRLFYSLRGLYLFPLGTPCAGGALTFFHCLKSKQKS